MGVSGVFLAVIIESIVAFLLIKQERRKASVFLNLYIITILLDFTIEYLVLWVMGDNSFIDSYPSSFRFVKGPLLFLLGRCIIRKDLGRYYLMHFCPFFIMFALNVFHLIVGSGNPYFHAFYLFVFSKLYPFYWGFYLLMALIEQLIARKGLGYVSLQRIFIAFLSFVLLAMVGYVAMAYSAQFDRERLRLFYTLSFFIQFGFLLRINNLIRKRLLIENKPKAIFDFSFQTLKGKTKARKYKNTGLTPEYIEVTNAKIIKIFTEQKVFTKEDFQLEDLSNLLQVSKYHLSQCISEGLNTTFYELINKYRIQEFTHMLHEQPDALISDLYYQCGFRSKATFYKYFKQEMHMTPNDYKRLLG